MFRLHGFNTQNTKKVLYVLEELKLDYEYRPVNLMTRENRTPEFIRINPFGKVPTLQHNDHSFFESGAICRYLANYAKSDLYPESPEERVWVDIWLDNFTNHAGRWINGLYYETVLKKSGRMGPVNEDDVTEYTKLATDQLKVIDSYLSGRTYLANDRLTIADFCAYAYLEQILELETLKLTDYENISNWFEKLDSQDSIQKAKKLMSQS